MADSYYNTIGDMWLGVIQYCKTVICVDVFSYSTITMSWTNGWSGGAGYVTIDLDSGALVQNFWAGETFGTAVLPLGYVVREQGLQNFLDVDYAYVSGAPNDIQFVSYKLFSLHVSMIANQCAVSAGFLTETNIVLSGMTNPVAYILGATYYSLKDFAVVTMVNVNQKYKGALYPLSQPYQQTYGDQLIVNASPVINVPPAPLPLDIDVGINQGQAILSVNSMTTTMLP